MTASGKALFKSKSAPPAGSGASGRRAASPSLRPAAVAGALLCALPACEAGTLPSLSITVEAGETPLFDHGAEACETWDIPDTPSRAYRDAAGDIHLFQSHFRNRALVGPGFGSLRHDCAVAYEGGDRSDPASFDHRAWIAATHTLDGRTVYGLVHDEFRGNRFAGACPSGDAMACWYNALTAVVSGDGGRTFAPMRPRLVAALPFRADETRGSHAGYFEPTNIVAADGAYFIMANVVSPPPQASGNCLLRTERLDDPSAWRGYRGGRFGTRFADPYAGPVDVEAQLCDPIAPEVLRWPVTSLTRFAATGTWIATMLGRAKDVGGSERTGVYYATSRDLLAWEGPALLLEAPLFGSCAPARPIAYPALIDPESSDRNFTTVARHPVLTFVRATVEGCDIGPDRDIVMQRVEIAP